MFELLFCSLFTIFPDYLFRRFLQGKRFGHEITLYSVWYELRYGITACVMLTVALITLIFYYHPATTHVVSLYRTVSILPQTGGRVAEVFVNLNDDVKMGEPIFRLDGSTQKAALDVANRRISEIEANKVIAQTDLEKADGQIRQAMGALEQARYELQAKQELVKQNATFVTQREIERLQNLVESRQGAVAIATATKRSAERRLKHLIPAELASAHAEQTQAQVELDKMIVRAGVDGRVEQFVLRVGDYVSAVLRPAGILIPANAGRQTIVAGFGQIEGQVLKVGMTAEITCISKPWTVIPMVVTYVQDYIGAGQVRASEQLLDAQQVTKPGTITVHLQPMFEGGLDGLKLGSSCIANAYTNNHELLQSEDISLGRWIFLHVIDTVALVHAMILRLQALVLPVKLLVLSGH